MAIDTTRIIDIEVSQDGINSVKALDAALTKAKAATEEAVQGTDEYYKALAKQKGLQGEYNRLLNQSAKESIALKGSYYDLNQQLVKARHEWKTLTKEQREGTQEGIALTNRIKELDKELKNLDAEVGQFQRNVGNYQSAFKGLADKTDALDKSLKLCSGGLNGVKGGFEAISKSPAIAIIGIVVTLVGRLASEIKDTESGAAAMKKAGEALKPVTDFFTAAITKLADLLGDIIGKVGAFVANNGLFTQIINGVVGVGNAVLNFVIAPFKGMVAAIKVLQDEGIKGIRNAAKAYGEELKNGVAFKSNFQTGQAWAGALAAGAKSKKAEEEAKAAGAAVADKMAEGFMGEVDAALAKAEKKFADAAAQREAWQKEWEALVKGEDSVFSEMQAGLDAGLNDITKNITQPYIDAINAEIEANERAIKSDAERKASLRGLAGATSNILGSIADAWETSGDLTEQEAERVKGIRTASAIIDTISGAVGAFMGITKDTGGWGIAAAVAEATAVLAAGYAQVANIQKTDVSGTTTTSAVVSAPRVAVTPTATAVTTGQSATDAIAAINSQPVEAYIVASKAEAYQQASARRRSETSW